MGITVTVGSIAGIPILIASGFIFKKVGLANTIILGFAFYVIRMMGEWQVMAGWHYKVMTGWHYKVMTGWHYKVMAEWHYKVMAGWHYKASWKVW